MFSNKRYNQFYTNDNPTERQRAVAKLLVQQMDENRKSPDIIKSGVIPRSIIQHSDLSTQDLIDAGFKKSLIAVPETGQSSLVTYRHPKNNLHFHKHPENWLFHEDKYPALSMVMAKYSDNHPNASLSDKAKFLFKKALPASINHIIHEGFPGWVNWLSSTIAGSKGLQHSKDMQTGLMLRNIGAGAAGISATEFLLSGGDKKLETLPGNIVGLAGMVAGNTIAKNLYNRLSSSDDRFKRPGIPATAILAGIPIISALVGKYGTNALVNRLRNKESV